MSNFNDEVCEFNSTPTTENFAGQNGYGIVYHKSNCSEGYVRWYFNGGNAPGSTCGKWIPDSKINMIHRGGDYNWRAFEDLALESPNQWFS
jgi:hypothetical protein